MYQFSHIKMTPLAFCKKDCAGKYIRDVVILDATPHAPIVRNDSLYATPPCTEYLPSELPYLCEPSNVNIAARVKDRALLREVVNIIPQVTEGRMEEGLAEQIALAHRRYILAAQAEFKKLIVKANLSPASPPRCLAPDTALLAESCSKRELESTPEHCSTSPRVHCEQNAIPPIDAKRRRRMGMVDNGALAGKLNTMLKYRVASKVWL